MGHLCVSQMSRPHTPSALAVRHTPATSPQTQPTPRPPRTRWSADQLIPNLMSLRSPFLSPRSTSHTQRARPRPTIASVTLPPGTRTGIARCLAPTAPILLTVSVVPAFRDTRDERCLRAEARLIQSAGPRQGWSAYITPSVLTLCYTDRNTLRWKGS
ncbi:hypothetical protein BGW80DRAFT_817152 [Lactifluus volemus]|nr:hypothetical protein BGW80DRAFT_817152 [Lactifluus volemus]